jgi:hypothetical protein
MDIIDEEILRIKSIMGVIVEQRGGSNKLSKEEFVDASQRAHQTPLGIPKYDYSLVDWVDTDTKVKVICPEHKDEMMKEFGRDYFMVFPNKHMQGQNKCPFENKRKETKHTDQDLEDIAKNFTSANEFKKMANSEWNASIKRGNEFYKGITSHFLPSSESAGEKIVAKILIDNDFTYEKQKMFEGCVNKLKGRYCKKLKFDFYIPSLNTVVEYDGEQHFRPSDKFGGEKFETTVENDLIKNRYCEDKGINLIRIPYTMRGDVIEMELISALDNQEPLQLLGNYPTKGWNANQ